MYQLPCTHVEVEGGSLLSFGKKHCLDLFFRGIR